MKPQTLTLNAVIDIVSHIEDEVERLKHLESCEDVSHAVATYEKIANYFYVKYPPDIKFNGGRLALLCFNCKTIVEEDFKPGMYKLACICDECKEKYNLRGTY
jgi:hypothetical protein